MRSERPVFGPINFKTRFPALDGIRALAVIMVFFNHFGGGAHGNLLMRFFNILRLEGYAGVDLFFVLSGLLITGILYDTRQDSQFFKRFFARRSVRIFPVVYLLFTILAILTPILGYQWRWQQLFFLVYLGNIPANIDGTLYGVPSLTHPTALATLNHLWSLCVEEQFYLIWPIIVWWMRDRIKLIWLSAGLCVASLMLRVIVFYSCSSPYWAEVWIVRSLPFRMDELLFGAILALLLRGPLADRIQSSMKWLFLGAGALTVLLWSTTNYGTVLQLTIGFTLFGLAATGLIGMTLRTESAIGRLFQFGPARVLGKYSYGFYLWHVVWGKAWFTLLLYLETRLHSLLYAGLIFMPLAFITTFLVAKLSYDFFEARFLGLKRHFEYDSELRTHQTAFAADGN